MCRNQHVDEIQLQQSDLPDDATDVPNIDSTGRSWPVKSLGGQRNAACLAQREAARLHFSARTRQVGHCASAYTRRTTGDLDSMGKEYTEIDDRLQEWSARQREGDC